jgi:hypothetical protein
LFEDFVPIVLVSQVTRTTHIADAKVKRLGGFSKFSIFQEKGQRFPSV